MSIVAIQCDNIYLPKKSDFKGLLMRDGKIAQLLNEFLEYKDYVGSREQVKELDLTGHYLCPGFYDGHLHIDGGGGEQGPASAPPPLTAEMLKDAGIVGGIGLIGTDTLTHSTQSLLGTAKKMNTEGLDMKILAGSYDPTNQEMTITNSVRKDLYFIPEIYGVKATIGDHRANTLDEEFQNLYAQVVSGSLLSNKQGVVHLHLGPNADTEINRLRNILTVTPQWAARTQLTHISRDNAGPLLDAVISLAKDFPEIHLDITCPVDPEKDDSVLKTLRKLKENGIQNNITLSSDGGGTATISLPGGGFDYSKIAGVDSGPKQLFRVAEHTPMPLSEAGDALTELVKAADIDKCDLQRNPKNPLEIHVVNRETTQNVTTIEKAQDANLYALASDALDQYTLPQVLPFMGQNVGKAYGDPALGTLQGGQFARITVFNRDLQGRLQVSGVLLPGQEYHLSASRDKPSSALETPAPSEHPIGSPTPPLVDEEGLRMTVAPSRWPFRAQFAGSPTTPAEPSANDMSNTPPDTRWVDHRNELDKIVSKQFSKIDSSNAAQKRNPLNLRQTLLGSR